MTGRPPRNPRKAPQLSFLCVYGRCRDCTLPGCPCPCHTEPEAAAAAAAPELEEAQRA